jgi:N-acetylglucosaminyl-diphospho-decaprenol L-rhamnosyltransferase
MTLSTGSRVLTVVLNYRTPDLTIRAVEAALAEMREVAGAITVVDNHSEDGSFEALSQAIQSRGWSRVRVMQSGQNGGYGAGNNFGIRQGLPDGTPPDFVYILNPDAVPEPGAISSLLEFMEQHPCAGFAGSRIHGEDGCYHHTAFRFPTVLSEFESGAGTGPISRLLRRYIVAIPEPSGNTEVDWVAGASLMVRYKMFEQTGGFDEHFFLYFEETDLSWRARSRGWTSHYVPASRVMHIGSVSTGMKTWRRTPEYWFDSRVRYFVKNHGLTYATAATLAYTAGALIFKLRGLTGKQRGGPAHYLSDMWRHALRSAWHRQLGTGPTSQRH